MVGGQRVGRQDSAGKKLASRLGNGIRKRLLNDEANDTGCGIKALRRESYLMLPLFRSPSTASCARPDEAGGFSSSIP